MRRIPILAVLLLLAAGAAFSQRWEREGEERPQTFVQYEALPNPGPDSLGSRVDIPFRIDQGFFIAVRSKSAPMDRPFARKGEILIELFDSTGTSAARTIEPLEATVASSEPVPGIHSWLEGITSLQVPPGLYHILVEVTDLQSRRSFADRQQTVRVPAWKSGELAVSTPFFVRGTADGSLPDTLRLENAGKDYLFGTKAFLAFLVQAPDTNGLRISCALTQDERSRKNLKGASNDSAAAVVVRGAAGLTALQDSAGPCYLVTRAKGTVVVGLSFASEKLPLRDYKLSLTVRQGTQTQTLERPFRAVWPEMPMSLRDVDEALEALRFLVPEEEVDRLKQGDFEQRRDSLEAFWKSRNRSTGTAYNELMAEYYRRVDYAMRTFGTLRQPDGTRTDRGKIFVLYGPPTSTERTLSPSGAYRETWKYEKLGRTFVFLDQSRSGNYVLVPSGGS